MTFIELEIVIRTVQQGILLLTDSIHIRRITLAISSQGMLTAWGLHDHDRRDSAVCGLKLENAPCRSMHEHRVKIGMVNLSNAPRRKLRGSRLYSQRWQGMDLSGPSVSLILDELILQTRIKIVIHKSAASLCNNGTMANGVEKTEGAYRR